MKSLLHLDTIPQKKITKGGILISEKLEALLEGTGLRPRIISYQKVTGIDPKFLSYEIYGILSSPKATSKTSKLLEEDLSKFTPMKEWFTKTEERLKTDKWCKARFEKPQEIIKGLYVCKERLANGKVCGCDEFFPLEKQTRSGDEGMTLFLKCGGCGKRFKQ
jgi:DNA-directed RNA polymerase subunit M/transcription elongation factor TFIIS